MTLQEVSERFGVAQSSVKTSFPRTQKAIQKKYGIKLVKIGRGKDTTYEIEEEIVEDDQRAESMFKENKQEIVMSRQSFQLTNWDFMVFLAIVTTPMLVFRGSYEDFLKYLEVPVNVNNIINLQKVLKDLEDKEYIMYKIDKTNPNYFIAALYRKVEEKLGFKIDIVKNCKKMAEKYNKRSWIPLLKVWVSVNVLEEQQPFTMAEIEYMTGLSSYQIREATKLLKDSEIFKTSKAYQGYQKCIGTNVDLNHEAFYVI